MAQSLVTAEYNTTVRDMCINMCIQACAYVQTIRALGQSVVSGKVSEFSGPSRRFAKAVIHSRFQLPLAVHYHIVCNTVLNAFLMLS